MLNSTEQQEQDSAVLNAELPIIVSREEAIIKGLRRYFTGVACKRGHISERMIVSRNCVSCSARYRAKNKVKIKAYNKQHKQDNKIKIAHQRLVSSRRFNSTVDGKVTKFARACVYRMLNLSGEEKIKSTCVTLGYSYLDLRSHIESLWLTGMSWDNYGLSGWHIDHVKSIKSFIDEGVTDAKVISSLSNLQPMWAIDNLIKGAK